MKKIGIYRILNTVNHKQYIGSSIDIESRWNHHRKLLRKGNHHSKYLQHAWNKYGEPAFKFEFLWKTNTEDLLVEEQICFQYLSPAYNVTKLAGSCLGCKHIEETKKANSMRNLGKKLSLKHKRNISLGSMWRRKKVLCRSLDNKSAALYDCISDAVKDGFDRACIAKCIKGERSSHKGFTWHLVEESSLATE